MKLRLPSIAFLALLVPIAAVGALEACGGNEDNGDAGPDATADAPPDVAKEAASETGTDASCANDVDLTQYLPSADASFDVEAGINLSACTGCLKTSCGTDINTCNTDCDCRQTIIDAITCVTQGGNAETCFGTALLNGDQTTQDLFTCALGSCGSICIPSDGGASDGGSSSLDGGSGG
ncbi:MAG TPA: hypothetical protein VGH87_10050 [Polyangiaceae bacterium]|jgi:hypothetical protein